MKNLYFILFFLPFLSSINGIFANVELIKDFMNLEYLSHVCLFTCGSKSETLKMFRYLMANNFKVSRCIDYDKCFYESGVNTAFIADSNCNGFATVVHKASILRKFSHKHHWLILSKSSINITFWNTINLGVDSNVKMVNTSRVHSNDLIHENINNTTLVLFEAYNTGYENNGVLLINVFGTWSNNNGITKRSRASKISERSDLRGLILKTSAIITQKFQKQTMLTYVQNITGDLDILCKSHMFAVLLMSKMFNYRLDIKRLTTWGAWNEKKKSFDGQLGELQHGRLDVGGTGVYLRRARVPYVDFLGKFTYQRSIIVFKQPSTISDSVSGFLKPLQWCVWWMAFGVLLLFITTIILSLVLERLVFNKKKWFLQDDLSSSLLMVIALFCQQGDDHKINLYSTRLLLFCCMVFSFLLFQFYSASIVSSLLSETPRVIKSTQDLLNSDMKFRIHNISFHKVLFDNTQIEIAKKIYDKKCANGTSKDVFITLEEGIRLALSGGYALYGDTDDIYGYLRHINRKQICDLDELSLVPKDHVYLGARRKLSLRDMLAVGLRRLHERGIISKETLKWRLSKPPCGSLAAQTKAVGLLEMRAAFQLMLWGYLFACILLFLEISYCLRSCSNCFKLL